MKLVLESLFKAVPAVGNVVGVILAMQLVFAVLGMQLFMGELASCTDPSISTKAACPSRPGPRRSIRQRWYTSGRTTLRAPAARHRSWALPARLRCAAAAAAVGPDVAAAAAGRAVEATTALATHAATHAATNFTTALLATTDAAAQAAQAARRGLKGGSGGGWDGTGAGVDQLQGGLV